MIEQKPKPEKEEIETTEDSGDRISVGDIEKSDAVAVGRGARAEVKNIFNNIQTVINLQLLPVVVVLVAIIAGLVWFQVLRQPAAMPEGDFNVAVAEFIVMDPAGNSLGVDDGEILANSIRRQIDTNFEALEINKVTPYTIWGPENTGQITGNTAAEREQAAVQRAKEINADILVYGVLTFDETDGQRSGFQPEFYVNHRSFNQAQEIAGKHKLGSKLRISLPLSSEIQMLENPALSARINALNHITIGLIYYSLDDYETSISYFEKAVNEERWLDGAGKEIGYLLLGNAFSQQSSLEKSGDYISEAVSAYDEALRINENYGRAMIGRAAANYLTAVDQNSEIDIKKLNQIADELTAVLSLEDQAITAYLEPKVDFYLGQIDLALFSTNFKNAQLLTQADNRFVNVIQAYEGVGEVLSQPASHAYMRRALIAKLQGDLDQAIKLTEEAIAIASPIYEGEFLAYLGDLYKANDQIELAENAYLDAIAVAESNGDEAKLQEYQESLEELR